MNLLTKNSRWMPNRKFDTGIQTIFGLMALMAATICMTAFFWLL